MRLIVITILMGCVSLQTWAFSDRTFYLGVGYFSENSLGRITQKPSGQKSSVFGTITYPLLLKYDWKIGTDFFFSPQLTYTIFNRKSAGDSAEVQIWHLMLPFGKNFSFSNFDWFVGPGWLSRSIKGAGGTTELNNGGSVSTFALPGRVVASKVITWNAGISYNTNPHRFAFDLMVEGMASSKRTFDMMFSYAYSFGRGF